MNCIAEKVYKNSVDVDAGVIVLPKLITAKVSLSGQFHSYVFDDNSYLQASFDCKQILIYNTFGKLLGKESL